MEPDENKPHEWKAPDPPPSLREPVVSRHVAMPKKKRGCLRRVLMAMGFVLALFVLLAFLVFRTTAGAEKDARVFVTSVLSGKTDDAWTRTTTQFREKHLRSELSPIPNARLVNIGRSIAKVTGQPTTATIAYRVTSATRMLYARVMLIKQTGKWRVQDYELSDKEFATTG